MGQNSLNIFLAFISILAGLFIAGIILFASQYRKKKLQYVKEKGEQEKQHQLDLLNTQLDTQQQTMQHIGREIHDNIGQKLTLASIYSKQLSSNTEVDTGNKLNSISNIIDESLAELRQLSKTLDNPELAKVGILSLLQEEARRVNASGICYLAVSADENINLQASIKNTLFRLLQEFIQNSLKHAACKKINIELRQNGPGLFVKATDDGKGFDASAISTGMGQQNMKRRAELLNAAYSLTSGNGNGTTLTLQVPLTA
jgi:signal transduction histidine kinase